MESPEKFISIEYDKWMSFYKPLEDKFAALKKENDELKQNKKILVYLQWWSYNRKDNREVGAIDILFSNDTKAFQTAGLTVSDKLAFRNAISDVLTSEAYYGRNERIFVIRDEFERKLKQYEDIVKKTTDKHNQNIALLSKITLEREALRQERAAIRLPRFLSKLFKTK